MPLDIAIRETSDAGTPIVPDRWRHAKIFAMAANIASASRRSAAIVWSDRLDDTLLRNGELSPTRGRRTASSNALSAR